MSYIIFSSKTLIIQEEFGNEYIEKTEAEKGGVLANADRTDEGGKEDWGNDNIG